MYILKYYLTIKNEMLMIYDNMDGPQGHYAK